MRYQKFILITLILAITAGCKTCNKKRNIAAWATKIDGISIPLGTMIIAELKYIDDEEEIDSVVYTINNKRISASSKLTDAIKIESGSYAMGMYNITATVYTGDKKEVHVANITILSDIIPKQLEKQTGAVYPHSNTNFTEGLFFHNGMLYESTGLIGNSFICRYKLGSTKPEKLTTLAPEYFGEGSIIVDNKLIQLTWKNGIGVVYDATTFKQLREFRLGGEGWGLSYDGTNMIMSDGTHRLIYLDKETYAPVKIIEVYDNKGSVMNLNELEYVDGIIYANIWQTDKIAMIEAKSGKVLTYINCEGLLTEAEIEQNKCDVLNGIAYDPQTKKLYITGKNWPKIFELTNQ